jgi:hypothetical protein
MNGCEFVTSLLRESSQCVVSGLEFLTLIVQNPDLYTLSKMARIDESSILIHAALLLTVEVQKGRDEVKMRRAVVRLFSTVVGIYADWDTFVEGNANNGSGGIVLF